MKNDEYLDSMLNYEFRHERYSHPAGENWPAAVNKSSYTSLSDISIGRKLVIVDTGCESHFITLEAMFIEVVKRGKYGTDDWMLFKVIEKQDGYQKGTYFLVKPTVYLSKNCITGSAVLKLELSARHCLGKNRNHKVVIQEEELL